MPRTHQHQQCEHQRPANQLAGIDVRPIDLRLARRADLAVDADAADIGHEDARLAGDVGAHVPGIGLRIERALRHLVDVGHPFLLGLPARLHRPPAEVPPTRRRVDHIDLLPRALSDIGSHWLDLLTFITGLHVDEVYADFKTFHPIRKKPTKPLETFTGKMLTPEDYIDQPINTEDYATVMLRYSNGARGVMTVAQVCAGRKNRLYYEINGAKSAIVWDGERPNELWINHRERPNELLLKDPALLSPEARQFASYPGGHNEGFPDTFKQLYRAIYRYLEAGDFNAPPDFPTFEDGHRALRVGEAIFRSAKEERWVSVSEIG